MTMTGKDMSRGGTMVPALLFSNSMGFAPNLTV